MGRVRLAGDVAGFVELSAPSAAGNNTLTLPTGNGSASQVLTTDGSGFLSWTTPIVYVTSGDLTSTLSGYVTTTGLNTTLSGYVTTTGLNVTLSGYATTGSLASYAALSGATFTGTINTRTIDVNSGAYQQTVVSVGTGTSFNCSSGNYFTSTVSGTPTYTVTGVPSGRSYAFVVETLHTSGTITWFSGVEWPGGTAPTLTTGKTHLFIFHTDDQGSRWRGSYLVNYTT